MLKFGFLALLYLFLLWIARSALKDVAGARATALVDDTGPTARPRGMDLRAGEVASRMAVEQFDDADGADKPPEQQLAEVAKGANRKIHEMAQEDSAYAGMGTTFTAALVTGREIAIGHVGDSRLYRFRDDELERLTHDHSLVEEFVRQGKLTPEEAEVHPQRSIITRALGPEPDVEVDTYTHAGRDGDVYLINSDGLTGMSH